MRIEGAPRYHISTLLQTPPAFLVLSSHALCALGRFLICFQGNRLYLWFFFFALVCCSLYACRLRLACLNWFFFQNLHRFLAGSELFSVLRATMWLQVEEVATTEFLLVEKVYVAFSNFSRVLPLSHRTNQKLWCVFRWPSTHERPYVGGKFQIFDHPLSDVLDETIFLRLLGNVIVRKRSVGCFFGK